MYADLAVDYFRRAAWMPRNNCSNSTVTEYEQALELNESRSREELPQK